MNKSILAYALACIFMLGIAHHDEADAFIKRSYNKDTKKDDLILVSTEKEKQIGRKISMQVKKKYDEVKDPLIQKRIEDIGVRIASVCGRDDVIYRFRVLAAERDDEYNAFAIPGGYIYIFDSLVNMLETDDRIAAILAHEIAHVAAKHSIKKLQSGLGSNILMLLAIGLSSDKREVMKARAALGQLMMAYSRKAEIEADRLSVKYLKEAGFDPEGVVESLKCMRNIRKKGPIRRYIYYKSHPYISERIAKAEIEVKGQVDFDSFINIIDREDF